MLFDWFTVIAQIINFLILVALLRRFLYRPIVDAMAAREQRIASRLEMAEQKMRAAEQEIETYRRKNQELQEQREQMLQRAREEVEIWRKEQLNRARQEIEETQARWYRAIQQEKEAFLRDLQRQAGHQIYTIARQALADLANADLEKHIIQVFLQRLSELEGEAREKLWQAIQKSGNELLIRSSFELPADMRQEILSTLQEHLAVDGWSARFELSPEVIGGIEIQGQGHKVSWSLASYLETLEESLARALRDKSREKAIETAGVES
jgi:F-type H+-transporting ATPase subunit b